MGLVRKESFGTLVFSLSADFVSSRRKLGKLGLRGGGGRLNPIDEGGGDGVASVILTFWEAAELEVREEDDVVNGISGMGDRGGRGDGGFDDSAETGSISANFLAREGVEVSIWNRPPPLRSPPVNIPDSAGGSDTAL